MWTILFIISALVQTYVFFSIYSIKKGMQNCGENLFLSLATVLCTIVFVATVIGVFEVYSFRLLNTVLLVESIGLLIITYQKKLLITIKAMGRLLLHYKFSKIFLVVFIITAVLYFAFPTKYLLGGRDPGLYLINGVHISQTGGMQYDSDAYIDKNYESIKNITSLSYPGLYSAYESQLSKQPGKLIAQFLPMFPSALAVGYDIDGIDGIVRVNCIIGLMALLAIYYFTKRYFGEKPAIMAAIFMAVNPAQLWNARITQTELLAQILFFLSVYVFAQAWNRNSWKLGALSGFLIGAGIFNRIDLLIFGLGVYAVVCYCALFKPKLLNISIVSTIMYTVTATLALCYGFTYSTPYLRSLINAGLKGIVGLNLIFLAVSVFLVLLRKFVLKGTKIKNLVSIIIENKLSMCLAVLGLLMLFLFTYFIRPLMTKYTLGTSGFFNADAMVEFCFYTSFFAIPLAIIGFYEVMRNKKINPEAVFLFILISLASIVGYIYRPSISNDHIWASRRWITVCIPAIFIFCSVGIVKGADILENRRTKLTQRFSADRFVTMKKATLILSVAIFFVLLSLAVITGYVYRSSIFSNSVWTSKKWIAVCVLAILLFCYSGIVIAKGVFEICRAKSFKLFGIGQHVTMKNVILILCVIFFTLFGLMQSRPFLLNTMLYNIDSQYQYVANDLQNDKIYYTENAQIASVLRFVYDKNVYLCQGVNSDGFNEYLKKNGEVYYIGYINDSNPGVKIKAEADHIISGEFLDRTNGVFPTGLFTWKEKANVYTLTASTD